MKWTSPSLRWWACAGNRSNAWLFDMPKKVIYSNWSYHVYCIYHIYILYTHILRDISIFIFSSLGFAANSNWRIPRLLSLLLSRMQPKRLSDYCSSFMISWDIITKYHAKYRGYSGCIITYTYIYALACWCVVGPRPLDGHSTKPLVCPLGWFWEGGWGGCVAITFRTWCYAT